MSGVQRWGQECGAIDRQRDGDFVLHADHTAAIAAKDAEIERCLEIARNATVTIKQHEQALGAVLRDRDAEVERLGEALKLIAASAPEAKPERLATLPSSPRGHVGFGEVAAMSYDLALWEAAEIARAALAPRADGGEG